MVGRSITPTGGGRPPRRGARPRRSPASTEHAGSLIRALIGGDMLASRKLRRLYADDFTALAASLRARRIGAEANAASAILTATSAVEHDPRGERTVGARWDATAFGAVALRALLRDVDHRPLFDLPILRHVPLAQAATLVLIDIEGVEAAEVGVMFKAPTTEVHEHHVTGNEALGLPEIEVARCPVWNMVARIESLPVENDDRLSAEEHLERCAECRVQHVVRRRRVEALTKDLDVTGWGDVGRAWTRRHRY